MCFSSNNRLLDLAYLHGLLSPAKGTPAATPDLLRSPAYSNGLTILPVTPSLDREQIRFEALRALGFTEPEIQTMLNAMRTAPEADQARLIRTYIARFLQPLDR